MTPLLTWLKDRLLDLACIPILLVLLAVVYLFHFNTKMGPEGEEWEE